MSATNGKSGVIRYDQHAARWEYWYESRCIAFSQRRDILEEAYPQASVQERQ